MDEYLSPHADDSITTGIRMVNTMIFARKDAAYWQLNNPDGRIPEGEGAYEFKYKLSMSVVQHRRIHHIHGFPIS
jgi:hypothetical protein